MLLEVLEFVGKSGERHNMFFPSPYSDAVEVHGTVDAAFFQHGVNCGCTGKVADGAPVFIKIKKVFRPGKSDGKKLQRIVTLGFTCSRSMKKLLPEFFAELQIFRCEKNAV